MPTLKLNKQTKSPEFSYRDLIRQRFRYEVSLITQKYDLQELILVIDIKTTLLISNLFNITELVEMKITYLERIQYKRKRMPSLHALYFLPPTQQSIEHLKADFPDSKRDSEKRQYKRIHILFTTFLPKPLLREVALCKPLLKRIAQNSFKEFYHSSRLLSPNSVVFDVEYMASAFSNTSESQSQEQRKRMAIAERIMQFVVNASEINCVRIYYKKSSNGVSQMTAQYTQKAVSRYISSLLEGKSHKLRKQADDLTILLMDRSVDPVTPLLHSFTYEALLFDLLKVTFEGHEEAEDKEFFKFKEFNDQIYQQYRYCNISKALQELPNLLEKQNAKLASLQKHQERENQIDIAQLNQTVKSLRMHIEMLDILYKEFKVKQLSDIGELEQSLATGLSGEAKNTSSSSLLEDVVNIVKTNQKLSKEQKLRLGVLVLCCIKLSKKDYEVLLSQYEDQKDKSVLKHIIALGITYDKSIGRSTKAISKDQQKIASSRLERTQMPLDRYTCILELIIPMVLEILSGDHPKVRKLDQNLFGMLKCSMELEEDKGLDLCKFDEDNFVITMVGGMSFAEVSALRRVDRLKRMVIGMDQILTPKDYLSGLADIDLKNSV